MRSASAQAGAAGHRAGGRSVTRTFAAGVGTTDRCLRSTSTPGRGPSWQAIASRYAPLRDVGPAPDAAVDVVHVRLLPMFLSPLLGALRRLVRVEPPGGWVVSDTRRSSPDPRPSSTQLVLTPWGQAWGAPWMARVLVCAGDDPQDLRDLEDADPPADRAGTTPVAGLMSSGHWHVQRVAGRRVGDRVGEEPHGSLD
jgi:hypothetical protein